MTFIFSYPPRAQHASQTRPHDLGACRTRFVLLRAPPARAQYQRGTSSTAACLLSFRPSLPCPNAPRLPREGGEHSARAPSRLDEVLDGALEVAVVLEHQRLVQLVVCEAHLVQVVQQRLPLGRGGESRAHASTSSP